MGPTWLYLLFFAGGSVGCVVTLADSRSFSCPGTLCCVRKEKLSYVGAAWRRRKPTKLQRLVVSRRQSREYAGAADRGQAVCSRGSRTMPDCSRPGHTCW